MGPTEGVHRGTDGQERKSCRFELGKRSGEKVNLCYKAYGEIKFSDYGQKAAKYACVCEDTDVKDVRRLLLDHWKLPEPKLLISVTGGAKKSNLSPRLEREFRLGIVKAARSTGAWLVTGGTNTGIMRQVGRAVREHGMTSKSGEHVPLIGVAPWGVLRNRQKLEGHQSEPVEYKMETCGKGEICLDCNHSHFLLVDDGSQGTYRTEIRFRTALEKELSTSGDRKVPVVLLVVNGGTGTLQNVSCALANGMPAVLMKGSGRAADALAYAFEETAKENVTLKDVEEDVKKMLRVRPEEEAECLKFVGESLEKRKLITVLELTTLRSARDVDAAILRALLKADSDDKHRLRLALTWNRADIAKADIAIDKIEDLKELVEEALIQNRPDFLDLLLEAGASLETMDKTVLVRLFTESDRSDLSHMVKKRIIKAEDVGKKNRYEVGNKPELLPKMGKLLLKMVGYNYFKHYTPDKGKPTGSVDLLLWAVLMNRPELAKIFWKRTNEKTTAALVVSSIFRSFAKYDEEAMHLKLRFQELADEWSQLAVSVLGQCYQSSDSDTRKLLVHPSSCWGGVSCIVTSLRSRNMVFAAQPACQSLRQEIWTGYWPGLVPSFSKTDEGSHESESRWSVHKKLFSPRVIFYTHLIFYLVFLLLYTYMVLVDDWTKFSVVGCIVVAWVFAIFVDIPIQISMDLARLPGSLAERLQAYTANRWRLLDMISVAVFAVGFGLRASGRPDLVEPSQVVLSLGFMVFCLRFLYNFTISQKLGPKLVMIEAMMSDLAIFCAIFFIFVASYAIASEAILYPNAVLAPSILYRVPRKAFWQIFGEFFLEDIEGASDCNESAGAFHPGSEIRCPSSSGRYLAPVLLGVYIVITNVLLLNLLIAIFTRSFERVEKETELYWHFLRLRGVYELTLRSPLPPPLNLLYYVYWLVWFCLQRCNTQKFFTSPFQEMESPKDREELIQWENAITDFHLSHTECEETDPSDWH